MKITTIITALPLLLILFSCQSEVSQEDFVPETVLTVTASLPSGNDTRALISYGNDDKNREVFQWSDDERDRDCITLFNISKFKEFHLTYTAPLLFIGKIDGIKAEFNLKPDNDDEKAAGEEFYRIMEPGDVIFAILRSAGSCDLADAQGADNLISYFAGSTFFDQKIVENPTTTTALRHVNQMMRMYDIVTVEEKGKLPELQFKHLSAIMRVSLRNETGGPLFTKPSDLTFDYPTGNEGTFVYGFSKISVEGNETEGYHLKENFKNVVDRHPLNPTPPDSIVVYSSKATHKVNEMSQTYTLADGDTYELYAVVAPRIGKTLTGDSFTISLYDGVESGFGKYDDCKRYSITINNFNIPIEAGKRYWFSLTAVKEDDGETKLMFTSEWKALHPEKEENQEM